MDVVVEAQYQTDFTLSLYKAAQGDGDANTVMSPLSIATALAVIGAGAKGSTLSELTSVLKLSEGNSMHQFANQVKEGILKDGSGAGGPLVLFANGLFVDKRITLKQSYEETVKGSYGAEIRLADFREKAPEEVKAINAWVTDATRGKIENLLQTDSVDAATILVIVNALYFKGAWQKQFDKEDTVEEQFQLLSGQKVRVPFMRNSKKQCIKEFKDHKILKLSYARGTADRSFSMYILLPNKNDGLVDLEKGLEPSSLSADLKSVRQEVPVSKFLLPRFRVSTGFSVPEPLKALGLKAPFTPEADFSEIGVGSLQISDVVHKAFIEVNEEGTEAAAATAVLMLRSFEFAPLEPVEFVADHPFLFILREDVTGMILFIGRIADPCAQDS